ncbi:MAG: guanylate kinase [Turneriella sp.]|nr:guanylate kinase [Leptospiraceae bacterium]MCX7632344.1 guanylate kinase [Turneriella sp.]
MLERPLFVIAAPSGGGKNSVITILLEEEPRLVHSVSSTTRQRRAHEIDGKHYYFLSHEEFERRIAAGEFLEYARVLDNYYGTEIREIERIQAEGKFPILDIDVQGVQTLRSKNIPMVSVFILPPSLEELERRLRARGTENEEQIKKRLELARWEISQKDQFDHIVLNDVLSRAAAEVLAILRNHM